MDTAEFSGPSVSRLPSTSHLELSIRQGMLPRLSVSIVGYTVVIISFCCTFIYYFWLHGLFSSGSEWRLLSSYGVQASHRGGCSHCGARAPGVGYGRINEESRKSMRDGAALQRGRMNYCLLMYIHTYWLHHVHPPTQACTHTQHEHAHTTCSHYTRTHAHGSAHTLCTPHTHTVYCVLHTQVHSTYSHVHTHTTFLMHKPWPLPRVHGQWHLQVGEELLHLCTTEHPGEVAFALEHEGQV